MKTPLELQTVDIEGPVRWAELGGSGPPIVCVHGLGGNMLNWTALAPHLRQHGRVIALDLPGFGRTPLAGRSARVGDQAQLVARFLTRVVGRRALLAGSSMGGLISLHVAATGAPLSGLLLLAPAQPLPWAELRRTDWRIAGPLLVGLLPVIGELAFRALQRRSPAQQVEATLRLCCHDPSRVSPALLAAQVALMTERATLREAGPAFLSAARSVVAVLSQRRRFAELLAAVRVPTLIIHGRQDRVVSVASSRATVLARPDFALHEIANAGHMALVETPGEVAAALTDWLAGAGSRALAA